MTGEEVSRHEVTEVGSTKEPAVRRVPSTIHLQTVSFMVVGPGARIVIIVQHR